MKRRTRGGWFRRSSRKKTTSYLMARVNKAIQEFKSETVEPWMCGMNQMQSYFLEKLNTFIAGTNSENYRSGGGWDRRCTRLRPKNWVFTNKCCDLKKEMRRKYGETFTLQIPATDTDQECVEKLTNYNKARKEEPSKKDAPLYECKLIKETVIDLLESTHFKQEVASLEKQITSASLDNEEVLSNIKFGMGLIVDDVFRQAFGSELLEQPLQNTEEDEYETGFTRQKSKQSITQAVIDAFLIECAVNFPCNVNLKERVKQKVRELFRGIKSHPNCSNLNPFKKNKCCDLKRMFKSDVTRLSESQCSNIYDYKMNGRKKEFSSPHCKEWKKHLSKNPALDPENLTDEDHNCIQEFECETLNENIVHYVKNPIFHGIAAKYLNKPNIVKQIDLLIDHVFSGAEEAMEG